MTCKKLPKLGKTHIVNPKLNFILKGKLGIDLERKMVIHDEKDPNVWKAPSVDRNELQEAKKYATPERKVSYLRFCPQHIFRAGLTIRQTQTRQSA